MPLLIIATYVRNVRGAWYFMVVPRTKRQTPEVTLLEIKTRRPNIEISWGWQLFYFCSLWSEKFLSVGSGVRYVILKLLSQYFMIALNPFQIDIHQVHLKSSYAFACAHVYVYIRFDNYNWWVVGYGTTGALNVKQLEHRQIGYTSSYLN